MNEWNELNSLILLSMSLHEDSGSPSEKLSEFRVFFLPLGSEASSYLLAGTTLDMQT